MLQEGNQIANNELKQQIVELETKINTMETTNSQILAEKQKATEMVNHQWRITC